MSATVGERIRDLRQARGMSQKALADAIGMRSGPLCNIETGRNLPGIPTLLAICGALQCTPNDVLAPNAESDALRHARAALKALHVDRKAMHADLRRRVLQALRDV